MKLVLGPSTSYRQSMILHGASAEWGDTSSNLTNKLQLSVQNLLDVFSNGL